MNRRLAAVLMADVVGYSRLMEADEAGTLAALKQRRIAILEPIVRDHGGRIVKLMGDGVLVEFASAVERGSGAPWSCSGGWPRPTPPLPADRRDRAAHRHQSRRRHRRGRRHLRRRRQHRRPARGAGRARRHLHLGQRLRRGPRQARRRLRGSRRADRSRTSPARSAPIGSAPADGERRRVAPPCPACRTSRRSPSCRSRT